MLLADMVVNTIDATLQLTQRIPPSLFVLMHTPFS